MTPKDALKSMELKFSSSNPIPVERAVITIKEWEPLYKIICDHNNLVVPALRAVWKYWSDINDDDPNAEGYDTIQMIKEAIDTIEK